MVEAVDRLQPGATSGLLELPVGCAVLRLVERREVAPVSLEQARAELESALYDQKFEQEYERFIEKLRKQTYVDRKGAFANAGRLDAASDAETTRLR
jgi:hypothetical protein